MSIVEREPDELPPSDNDDLVNVQQKFFTEALEDVQQSHRRFSREALGRRGVAYVLKAISIFGAIIVAAQLKAIPQVALGLIIAGAVAADQLTSNHMRLVAVVAAKQATERLLAKIRTEHTGALPEILALRNVGQKAAANNKLITLLAKLIKDLRETNQTILDGVREVDLKSLNNLYIDVKKT